MAKRPASGQLCGTRRLVDALALAVALATAAVLFRFTADDAFIVARVARHLVLAHEATQNLGDRVNVLTSPLEGLLLAALISVGLGLSAYKALSVAAVSGTLLVAARLQTRSAGPAAVFFALTAASPLVMLWTVGGLETPLLLVAATSVTLAWPAARAGSLRAACVLCAAATVACWARYDAVLFVGWPVAALLRDRSPRVRALVVGAACASAAAVALPALYFGHLLPVPFYLKASVHPSALLLGRNALYLVMLGVLSGLAPLALASRAARPAVAPSGPSCEVAPLLLGLGSVGAYGLLVGTAHMLFGYRLFIPYLPTIALLAVARWPAGLRAGACLLVGQLALTGFVLARSVNPTLMSLLDVDLRGDDDAVELALRPSERRTYEYSREGVRAYALFLDAYRGVAEDAARDWARGAPPHDGPPRILAAAAGVVGDAWPEARLLDPLSSFRLGCKASLEPSADYIVTMTEATGAIPPDAESRLIGTRELVFDGAKVAITLLRRPSPAPDPLPHDLFGPCAAR